MRYGSDDRSGRRWRRRRKYEGYKGQIERKLQDEFCRTERFAVALCPHCSPGEAVPIYRAAVWARGKTSATSGRQPPARAWPLPSSTAVGKLLSTPGPQFPVSKMTSNSKSRDSKHSPVSKKWSLLGMTVLRNTRCVKEGEPLTNFSFMRNGEK